MAAAELNKKLFTANQHLIFDIAKLRQLNSRERFKLENANAT